MYDPSEIRRIALSSGYEVWANRYEYLGIYKSDKLCGGGIHASHMQYINEMSASGLSGIIKAKYLVTSLCNQSCYYCYNGKENSATELNADDAKKIIYKLRDEGIVLLQFHGGEPSVRKDFPELLKTADRNGMLVWFFTNGSVPVWNKDGIYECISSMKTSPHITVSVLSAKEEEHDCLSGHRGAYKQLISTVERLRGLKCNVTLSTSLNQKTYGGLKEVEGLAKALDCKVQIITEVFSCVGNSEKNSNLHLNDEQINYARESILKSKKILLNEDECATGKGSITIDESGNLIGCERSRKLVYGNVLKDRLTDIINSIKFQNDIRTFFSKPKECKECDKNLKIFCKWCASIPANHGIEQNKWREYHCDMARKRRLFWFGE